MAVAAVPQAQGMGVEAEGRADRRGVAAGVAREQDSGVTVAEAEGRPLVVVGGASRWRSLLPLLPRGATPGPGDRVYLATMPFGDTLG